MILGDGRDEGGDGIFVKQVARIAVASAAGGLDAGSGCVNGRCPLQPNAPDKSPASSSARK
jgi:hypothetical protein